MSLLHADPLFTGSTTNVYHVAQLLQTISPTSNATLLISASGLAFTVHHHHVCKIRATVHRTLFADFALSLPAAAVLSLVTDPSADPSADSSADPSAGAPASVEIGVDLAAITECFNMQAQAATSWSSGVHTNTSTQHAINPSTVLCVILYLSPGSPLVIDFQDEVISERVEFSTFHVSSDDSPAAVLTLDHLALVYELMLKLDVLHDILKDLKDTLTDDLFVYVLPAPELTFISRGELGYSKLIFPSERTVLELLTMYGNGADRPVVLRYNYPMLTKVLRAVRRLYKTKVFKDARGLMLLVLLVASPELAHYHGLVVEFSLLEMDVELVDSELNALCAPSTSYVPGETMLALVPILPDSLDGHEPETRQVLMTEPASMLQSHVASVFQSHAVLAPTVDDAHTQVNETRYEPDSDTHDGAVEVPLFL